MRTEDSIRLLPPTTTRKKDEAACCVIQGHERASHCLQLDRSPHSTFKSTTFASIRCHHHQDGDPLQDSTAASSSNPSDSSCLGTTATARSNSDATARRNRRRRRLDLRRPGRGDLCQCAAGSCLFATSTAATQRRGGCARRSQVGLSGDERRSGRGARVRDGFLGRGGCDG